MALNKQVDIHYKKNTSIAYIDYAPGTDLKDIQKHIIQHKYYKTYDFWTDVSNYDNREWICMRHKSFNKIPRDGSEKMSPVWKVKSMQHETQNLNQKSTKRSIFCCF